MTHSDFEASAREVIENYWRIRAALKLMRPTIENGAQQLQFEGIPQVGCMSGLLQAETIAEAHISLGAYVTHRLSRDMFLALIAAFEQRLISWLSMAGQGASGTLGGLQHAIQKVTSLPSDLIKDLDEVRERRNAQMHHNGLADDKYVAAALKVNARAPNHVPIVAVGTSVVPDGHYLTYAADVLARYSAAI